MMEMRRATAADAGFVAWTVLTALDMDEVLLEIVARSCADEASMYSWSNATLAVVDGRPVGCLIAYDGARYRALRRYTWPTLSGGFDAASLDDVAEETQPGEMYLDSMAILPEYRGHGIGKSLLLGAIEEGKKQGFARFTLIVDVAKPRLKRYYESIGFEVFGEMLFFDHRYYRMAFEVR